MTLDLKFAFSTNPNYKPEEQEEHKETLAKDEQCLNIYVDTKQRKGKPVVIIEGFIGSQDDLKTLSKQIKIHIGVGGSCKNGLIIIQGKFKEKIYQFLIHQGYKNTKVT